MKLSIAEVKRRLPVGTEFTAEFCGPMNIRVIGNLGVTNLVKPESERITRRRVLKQTSEMVSDILTGPKAGHPIYLTWKGVAAREENGTMILTNTEVQPPEDFLKITV